MSDLPLQEIAGVADSFEASERSGRTLEWHSTSRTDVGRVRPVNEDAFLDSPAQRLWVVADGMGGQSRGDYASGAVVKQLSAFPHHGSLLVNLKDLEDRLQAANERCRTAFRNKKPGTTVVALLAHGNYCFFLWAGDSRVYRLRGNTLELLTEDHSVARQMHQRGEITAEEAEKHPKAHVLTRAVGVRDKVQLDLGHAEVHAGDRFLLCSDGLYNCVTPAAIAEGLGGKAPEDACTALVEAALAGGGRDNITLIVADASCPR